tara:strand:+ start:13947 stop:14858 length:912 start_codon:yes stop_codon:yes gene_type:complete
MILNILTILFLLLSLWINNSAVSIFLGIFLALLFRIPDNYFVKRYGSKILQTGIVFLGGSLSVSSVYETNADFFVWITLYVFLAFGLVLFLGKIIGINEKLTYLLASGTSICGGTAIASVAPSIRAKSEDLTAAITIIFILNAIAVLLFPLANEYLELSDRQFGAWVALAIHDTASVVGAASSVSETSVEVSATLKVARTLWIVPLVIFSSWLYRSKKDSFGLPVFVIFFIVAVALNTLFNPSEIVVSYLKLTNEVCLLTGLFCIGTQINKENLMKLQIKPVVLACISWTLIIPTSLFLVLSL